MRKRESERKRERGRKRKEERRSELREERDEKTRVDLSINTWEGKRARGWLTRMRVCERRDSVSGDCVNFGRSD